MPLNTLAIIQRLKKRRPELADDPLFAELEMASAPEAEDEMLPEMPSDEAEGSYLDDPMEGLEGEMDMEAIPEDMEADMEAMEEPSLESEAASYLDEEEDEEMPPKKGRRGSMPLRFR